MSKQPFREDRNDLEELLNHFKNLKEGRTDSFIEEDGFDVLIDYFKDKEDYPNAIEAVRHAVKQYPFSAALMLQKADLLIILKKYQQALHVLDQAATLDGNDAELYILKTESLLALGLPEKAEEVLQEAVRLFSGEQKVELLFELADVYDDYEDYEKVFDCLKMILDVDPSNEEALYKICFWTDYTGRNEEGIRLHQDIIEKHPFNELAWFNLGAAYQGLKLYEKAIDAYQYAIAIDDKFDYAYRNMGDAFIRLKKYKEAIEVLSKVLELGRPDPVIFEALGHCHDKLNNFSQARFHYKKASHLDPEDSQLYYKVALTFMKESQWSSAIKNLEIALKIHVMQPEYNLALGQCQVETGNFRDAIDSLCKVVQVRPKSTKGWVALLLCLYQAGFFQEGLEYTDLAFEQTEHKPIFIYYRSLFLFANNKTKEALLWLERAIAVNPKLIRQFLDANASLLQIPQVVSLIAGIKKKRTR